MSNCFECKHLEPRSSSGLWKCLKAHNYFRTSEKETMEHAPCVEFEPKNEQTGEVKMPETNSCFECDHCSVERDRLETYGCANDGSIFDLKQLHTHSCNQFKPKVKEPTRFYDTWNANKKYTGRVAIHGGSSYPTAAYLRKVDPPECPKAPDYPDGWYYLEFGGDTFILRKRGATMVNGRGKQLAMPWSHYTVIASLEGVRFVNGGDHE